MATIGGRNDRTLKEHMLRQYGDFNVFQLMRLLLADPESTLPLEQRLRFRADLSAAFPAREFSLLGVRQKTQQNDGNDGTDAGDNANEQEVIEIRTANFCIASILGPLPESFTEWVRDLVRERSPAMADFFDIFNQRLNLLRFQLKRAQITALNSAPPADTDEAHALASLMGLGSNKLTQQIPLAQRRWLGMAGLLANRRKCASNVEQVLSLVLGMQFDASSQPVKVTLLPLIGAWANIEEEDRIGLGSSNHALGLSSVLGKRVWDQQARVRLIIDSLDYDALCELLPPNLLELPASSKVFANRAADAEPAQPYPERSGFSHFATLILLLLDRMVDCEIEIHVRQNSIPAPVLQADREKSGSGLRLGQTAWLREKAGSNTDNAASAGVRHVRYLLQAHAQRRQA